VNRLATTYTDKAVRSLAGIQCLCTTKYRIDLKHLCWCFDELAAGRIVNQICVPPETRRWAVVVLERMLENVSAQPVSAKRLGRCGAEGKRRMALCAGVQRFSSDPVTAAICLP